MRPAPYLFSLTGLRCPGRLAIKTTRIEKDTADGKPRQQKARDRAEALVDYCVAISDHCEKAIVETYQILQNHWRSGNAGLENDDDYASYFDLLKDCCYPYLYISAEDARTATRDLTKEERLVRERIEAGEFDTKNEIAQETDRLRRGPILLPPRDHFITLAEPRIAYDYYVEQCEELLKDGYLIEAGLSIVPIPLTYALETRSHTMQPVSDRDQMNVIQAVFPMPNLAEVEDSVIDGRYRQRDESAFVNREFARANSLFWDRYTDRLRRREFKLGMTTTDSSRIRENLNRERTRILKDRSGVNEYWLSRLDDMAPRGDQRHDHYAGKTRDQIAEDERKFDMQRAIEGAYDPPRPLGYFDAVRSHHSYSRLRHYTATDPESFRKNVIIVSAPGYLTRFAFRAMCEIVGEPSRHKGSLVITPANRTDSQLVLARDQILEFFKGHLEARNEFLVENRIDETRIAESLRKLQTELAKGLTVQEGALDDATLEQIEAFETAIRRHIMSHADAQMPACHYLPEESEDDKGRKKKVDKGRGQNEQTASAFKLPEVTMINAGTGPSNAKTATDHLAVLRPNCWITVGHCGGLRQNQEVGDFVVASAYARRDAVLDRFVPLDAPVKTTRVILQAFEHAENTLFKHDIEGLKAFAEARAKEMKKTQPDAFRRVFGGTAAKLSDPSEIQRSWLAQIKRRYVQTGTVITTNDRNWETAPTDENLAEFESYRAVGIDMESATVATNGYRYRVHHGSLLTVSHKPLHDTVRNRSFQESFQKAQIARQLDTVLRMIEWANSDPPSRAQLRYSRELRGGGDPPWL